MGLFSKGADARQTETLAYIKAVSTVHEAELSQRLQRLAKAQRDRIWNAMALGTTGTSKAERQRDRDIRRAKRAAMLAAAVFIRDQAKATAEIARLKTLVEGEQQLQQRLASWFCLPGADGASVAAQAVRDRDEMPGWHNGAVKPYGTGHPGMYDMVRGRLPGPDSARFNCYNAVVYWAFHGGAISLRYLWNHWLAGNANAPDEYKKFMNVADGNADGPRLDKVDEWVPDTSKPKLEVENSEGQKRMISQFRQSIDGADGSGDFQVDAGLTVIFQVGYNKFGHTVLSTGGGQCISQNVMMAGNDFAALKQAFPGDAAELDKSTNARNHIVSLKCLRHYFNYERGYSTMVKTKTPFWEFYAADER
jgi:multidrug efflux pump subunit AcrA (membrane-fusion protein)